MYAEPGARARLRRIDRWGEWLRERRMAERAAGESFASRSLYFKRRATIKHAETSVQGWKFLQSLIRRTLAKLLLPTFRTKREYQSLIISLRAFLPQWSVREYLYSFKIWYNKVKWNICADIAGTLTRLFWTLLETSSLHFKERDKQQRIQIVYYFSRKDKEMQRIKNRHKIVEWLREKQVSS